MQVIKRNGKPQAVDFNKIHNRIKGLCQGYLGLPPLPRVETENITMEVFRALRDGISTSELDQVTAAVAQPLAFKDPQYGDLAGRVLVSNYHKNTVQRLLIHWRQKERESLTVADIETRLVYWTARTLWENLNSNGEHSPLIAPAIYKALTTMDLPLDYLRDYRYDFAGFQLLETSYLLAPLMLNVRGMPERLPLERPQHMLIRVALGIHLEGPPRNDIPWFGYTAPNERVEFEKLEEAVKGQVVFTPGSVELALASYEMTSQFYFTHATPTLFNSGTMRPQMSSCYLMQPSADSMDGITDYWKECANISQWAGGLGSHLHNIRGRGAYISGTNGVANGLVPMLRVVDAISTYIEQCFAGFTYVYTAKGPRMMKEIGVGDKLLTQDGSYRAVTAVRNYKCSDEQVVYQLATDYSISGTLVTAEHPMWARRWNGRELGEPAWVRVGELTTEHALATPMPTGNVAVEPLSMEAAQSMGERFIRSITDPTVSRQSEMEIMLNQPWEQTQRIIAGMRSVETGPIDGRIMSEWIKFLLLRFGGKGIFNVVALNTDANGVSRKPVPNPVRDRGDRWEQGCIWSRVTQISRVPYDGELVDFDIDTNENYVTEVGLAHNGGGKRPGTHAIYLSPYHPDFAAWLDLKKQRGNDQERARHLFYAAWIPDEFMRCVKKNGDWYTICPNRVPGLEELWDAVPCEGWLSDEQAEELDAAGKPKYAFTRAYRRAVREGKTVEKLQAQELWSHILDIVEETGVPYILFRDNVNRKSNHMHLGAVKSSNLCAEIVEYSSPTETAVCNLASICLPRLVVQVEEQTVAEAYYHNGKKMIVDWNRLRAIVRTTITNLDKVIDRNFYPNAKTRTSNMLHRPIGLGVQGLADLFCTLGLAYDDPEARALEARLFESISYWAIERSCELVAEGAAPFSRWKESPIGQGIFSWQMWITEQKQLGRDALEHKMTMNWDALRERVRKIGIRNSMLLALMPTASTSTIMGMSPCFEPHNSLVYKRRNRTGETTMVNRIFIDHMLELGLWTPAVQQHILADRCGSVMNCDAIPEHIRNLYKTVWDLREDCLTKAALVRAPYICQSQSLNLFIARPTHKVLNKIHFYAWSRGLKTSSYYTRRLAPGDAQKLPVGESTTTATTSTVTNGVEKVVGTEVCTMQDGCISCGS
jgi:ribonucleoside-diphosphate reductase alpha subunit